MTVPAPPLPEVRDLIAALVPRRFSEIQWTGGNARYRAEPYRMGRDALAAAISAIIAQAGASRLSVWFPDYICNEALERIRTLPVELRFYPIEQNLAPCWKTLEAAVPTVRGPAVLVLVHYFGVRNDIAEARAFCRRHNFFLIEDSAHILLPASVIESDALVYSPHKLLPVPDCAVLVGKEDLLRHVSVAGRSGLPFHTLRWAVKRLIQKMLVAARLSWHRWRIEAEGCVTNQRRYVEGTAADRFAISLLEVSMRRAPAIAARRRANDRRLREAIADLASLRPFFRTLSEDACPYVLPLCVTGGGGANQLSAALRKQGIPAIQWPDLPPEVKADRSAHQNAIALFENLILLPVHQTLLRRHLKLISDCLVAASHPA